MQQVSGLTYAAAVGYDWFYSEIPPEERAAIRAFIIDKGINLNQYHKYAGDFGGYTNRNIVANTGYLLGALAIWEDEPVLAASLWNLTTSAMQNGLYMYRGGAWWEGWVYWGYASEHALTVGLTLNATFGTDFGFSRIDGWVTVICIFSCHVVNTFLDSGLTGATRSLLSPCFR